MADPQTVFPDTQIMFADPSFTREERNNAIDASTRITTAGTHTISENVRYVEVEAPGEVILQIPAQRRANSFAGAEAARRYDIKNRGVPAVRVRYLGGTVGGASERVLTTGQYIELAGKIPPQRAEVVEFAIVLAV